MILLVSAGAKHRITFNDGVIDDGIDSALEFTISTEEGVDWKFSLSFCEFYNGQNLSFQILTTNLGSESCVR